MKPDKLPLNDQERELTELVRSVVGIRPFEPFAEYDRALDRVIVLARDCSVCEKPVGGVLTLYEDNYPEDQERKYVGFAIEQAREFYRLRSLDTTGPYQICTLLDEILDEYPFLSGSVQIAREAIGELARESVSLI